MANCNSIIKRVTGIGPATQAWEAWILPLNYTRNTISIIALEILLDHVIFSQLIFDTK